MSNYAWQIYLNAIEQQQGSISRGDLEPVRLAYAAMNLPSFSCPIITITGTNGKGSVATFLANLLTRQGYRTGLFTSPHLIEFNERIQINLQSVSDDQIAKAFSLLSVPAKEYELGWFDTVTLLALAIFAEANLDVMILEVGIGGRLDPTNILDANLAIVTSIALDHCHLLGNTREDIAAEKAGIFRSNKPAVIGDPSLPSTLLEKASDLNTPLYCSGRDFFFDDKGKTWSWHSQQVNYLSLPKPAILLNNAATALMAAELIKSSLPWNESCLRETLEIIRLPGRLQYLPGPIPVILDVAHNPAACAQLAIHLKENSCPGKTIAVTAFYADKDYQACLEVLQDCVNYWLVASSAGKRVLLSQALQQALEKLGTKHMITFDDVRSAFQHAEKIAAPGDRIVVFGSFSTVQALL